MATAKDFAVEECLVFATLSRCVPEDVSVQDFSSLIADFLAEKGVSFVG